MALPDLQQSAEDIALQRAMQQEVSTADVKSEPASTATEQPTETETPAETQAQPAEEPVGDTETQDTTKPELSDAVKRASPIDTIRELRAERRQLRDQVKEFNKWKQVAEERLTRLAQPQQAQAAAIPDPQTDPDGFYQAKIAALEKKLEPIEQQERMRQEQHVANQRTLAKIREAADYELEGIEDGIYADPAGQQEVNLKQYKAAIDFGKAQRLKELETLGVTDPTQREMLYQRDLLEVYDFTKRTGANLAQALFKRAQLWGFGAQSQKQVAEEGDGAARVTDRLQTLQRGQAAAKQISKGGGAGAKGLTLEELVRMDNDEFDRHNADRKKIRALMGG